MKVPSSHDSNDNNRNDNNKIESELVKLEVALLEQRILHLENLQYRLRQFSMALWLAALGVGLGITTKGSINFLLIGISSLIPVVFIYLDAWYASSAQNFRSRRNEITFFLNTDHYLKRSKREIFYSDNIESKKESDKFFLLDLNGDLSISDSKVISYRKSLIVKLMRTVRLWFYGFQMFGSSTIFGFMFAINRNNTYYYSIILLFPAIFCFLYILRNLKKRNMSKDFPLEYKKDFKEISDRDIYHIEF